MPWRPLPRIAFAVATFPFQPSSPTDLPLEIGDELYIIEQGGSEGSWYRGYLVAPPSLLAGLTSRKGQTLEARVFSGIFPRCCVEVREVLGDSGTDGDVHVANFDQDEGLPKQANGHAERESTSLRSDNTLRRRTSKIKASWTRQTVIDGEGLQESGLDVVPSPTPSQRKAHHTQEQGLGRTLSHRSIISPRSRQSSIEPILAVNTQREPGTKRAPAPVPMLKIGDETPTSMTEPLVDEIASCLREWHSKNLHELLLSRRYPILERLTQLVCQVDLSRRQLLHGVLTEQEVEVVREKTVWDLVAGNKLLSNEVIIRDPKQRGRLLTWGDSVIELSKLQSNMSLLEKPPASLHDPLDLYHLLVELKGCANDGLNSPVLELGIYSRRQGQLVKPLTETYSIDLPLHDQFEKMTTSGKFRSLFTDMTSNDLGEKSGADVDLLLVARIQANQLIDSIPSARDRSHDEEDIGSLSGASSGQSLSPSPAKNGRQSLTWAQKQLGSTRNRNRSGANIFRAASQAHPSSVEEARSRPGTRDAFRPTTQQGPQYTKRTIGVGVLNITHLIGHNSSSEQLMSIWSPAAAGVGTSDTDDYQWLLRELISGRGSSFVRLKSLEAIRLSFVSFINPDANELVTQTPTLLQDVVQTPKIGFPGAPKRPRSDIYLTLSEAVLSSLALLCYPDRSPVQIPSSLALKNVQLTLEVRKNNGGRVENCIFPYSNGPAQTAWRTTAVACGEPWNQTVKLVIADDDLPEAHLVMSIADAPGFPFALSWMPLWDQGAFIPDGVQAPLLYLYDKVTSASSDGHGAYLTYPWHLRARKKVSKEESSVSRLATLRLETYLCSTSFSQDEVLLGLLSWKKQSESQRLDLLKRFVFVPEIEIVKLLDEVFRALFDMLAEHRGTDEFEDLVFHDLVTVLGIIHDRRFNLGPLVDEYAETKFDYPSVTPCLIRSYQRLLASPADSQNSRRLRATFKVGRQILKFIVNAHNKQRVAEIDVGTTSNQADFNRELRSIFTALEALMRDPSPILVGSKTLAVQHMHYWLPELTSIYSRDEIFEIVSNFMDSTADVRGKLILYKLVLIVNLSESPVMLQESMRRRFIASTREWIERYWGSIVESSEQWREQIRLCCSIVSMQIEDVDSEVPSYIVKAIQSYRWIEMNHRIPKDCLSLLFPTSYPFPFKPISDTSEFDEPLIELSALLVQLDQKPASKQVADELPDPSGVIFDGLDVIKSILRGHAYPKSWLSLHVFQHRACLQTLDTIMDVMLARFLPSPDDADYFPTELWNNYLLTLLTLVSSETLALENFPEQKRRAVWKIAGDVREQGAGLLSRGWRAIGWDSSPEDKSRYGLSRLGGFQVQYVPNLVSPIVGLCLSVHEGLRGVAVRILQTMIVSEWTLSEDLSVIQAETIDCLDAAFKSKHLVEGVSQKLFINELLDLFGNLARSPGDSLWQAIKTMVAVIDELLDLLGAVHGTDVTEAFRIIHTLNLMDFLKDMQKQDIYIRYIHQLADIQTQLQNHTEAGLALRLHADLYAWNLSNLEPLTDPAYPRQTSFERKEQLYFEMIRCYEEGAAWSSALSSYRELAYQYEYHHYDFAKLARTQRSMAKIYESITKWERPMPRYFRVIYRGLGFPLSLRDKQFIFEGGSAERISIFTDRIRQQYPSAQLAPAGDIDSLEGQYLQIFPVSPHRDLEHVIYQQTKVPHSIREFVLSSNPRRFAVTSKRHSPASGVQDQWIEKTIYTTSEAFPTISKRSEVVAIDIVRLSPLQTAVERTSRKTAEIASLEKRIADGDESSLANLIEAVKSSVDPMSVASVSQYRAILPASREPTEEEQMPEVHFEPLQNALHLALLDHASSVKHALTVLARYNTPDHASLLMKLQKSFSPELALLAPQPDPTPPPTSHIPLSPALSPSHQHSSSFATITTSAPQLPVNGVKEDELEKRPMLEGSKRNSRLSLLFARSTSSVPKTNGSVHIESQKDDDSKSTSTVSHRQGGQAAPSSSVGRSGSQSLSRVNGAGRTDSGEHVEDAERPVTSQSSRSGRMKKRLSMLGIGAKPGSVKRKNQETGMGLMEEE